MMKTTKTAEELLSDLAELLEIPPERYESADRSYKSVCAWLERPESRFSKYDINVYTQGSFRLGTPTRPINGDEHYDLDIVCEFSIAKLSRTQKALLDDLGYELSLYAKAKGMDKPDRWQRCWTLNYADSAQFHMDVLPCLPDAQDQRSMRKAASLPMEFVEKSVAITDSKHVNYERISVDWPVSNPNGYAEWFYLRMKLIFEKRRQAMMIKDAKADVSEIPEFRVKTPLQSAIQILKRHRDFMFSADETGRPSSIVITTLAAHAYEQQTSIVDALFAILSGMSFYIQERGGRHWIPNPSNPRENFADAWNDDPKLREGFDRWLETAQTDFRLAAEQDSVEEIVETLAPRLGRPLVKDAAQKRRRTVPEILSPMKKESTSLQRVLDAPHRRPMPWAFLQSGSVRLTTATAEQNGFRPMTIVSDGSPLAAHLKLRFVAQTDIPRPFRVFWQVVNTGAAAKAAQQLRGNFEEVTLEEGGLVKKESTLYTGSHSIQCFIVKNGSCLAKTDPFIVVVK
jgi:hypothetical protein